jgi:hypothetical protein
VSYLRAFGRPGLGDSTPRYLNPAGGTSLQSQCGFWSGGVLKPQCWCASSPWLFGFSSAQECAQAQATIDNPGLLSSTVAAYPAAVSGSLSTSTAPAGTTESDFDAAYNAALQQGQADANAQNLAIMSSVNSAVQAAGTAAASIGGSSALWWIVGAAVVLVGVAMARRR